MTTDELPLSPRPSRRVSPLVILVIALAALIIVLSGVGFYVFSSHVGMKRTTPAEAARTLEQIRARFAGQTPLVTLTREGGRVSAHISTVPGPDPGGSISALRIIVFESRRDRLVRVTLPFWLIRWKGSLVRVRPFDNALSANDTQLTVKELERHGPGLIMDFTDPRGARVIMWAEGKSGR